MSLNLFFEGNKDIALVEVIGLGTLPPRLVQITGRSGSVVFLTTRMRDQGARAELGELVALDKWTNTSNVTETRISLAGGRVIGVDYLRLTDVEFVSGVRISFTQGELVVLPGDAPYSVFVSRDSMLIGRPEFPVSQYSSL